VRRQLLYNPRLLCERLAQFSVEQRRRKKLRGTPAEGLQVGHIDSLELLELVRPFSPRVIYDIGANIGTWTVLAKSLFPAAEVHSFEPLNQLKEEFSRRTRRLSGVNRHGVALGSAVAMMPMKLADFVDASSLLEMTRAQVEHYAVQRAGETMVQVETLDHYCHQQRLPRPDLIKLDIQGYEVEALRGAAECLQSAQAIVTEVSFIEFYEKQCLFHDVVQFLATKGFQIRAFSAKTSLGARLLQTDVLFERVSQNGHL
jgi:FkbM family methyltransferase